MLGVWILALQHISCVTLDPDPAPTLALSVTFTPLYFSSVHMWPDIYLYLHIHLHVYNIWISITVAPVGVCVCVCAQSLSHVQLSVTPRSLPGSSIHAISQAGTLEWVAIAFSRRSSWPRHPTHVSWVSGIGKWVLYHWATREAHIDIYK